MKFYKSVMGGYLIMVGNNCGREEITKQEYAEIIAVIQSKPTARDGFGYRLKVDLTWEEYELPPIPDVEEEPTIKDKAEAYDIMMGGGNE